MLTAPHASALGSSLGVTLPDPVLAYIGPGAGLGGIAVAIALALGVILLVAGLVWYPLKRVLKGRASGAASGGPADEVE